MVQHCFQLPSLYVAIEISRRAGACLLFIGTKLLRTIFLQIENWIRFYREHHHHHSNVSNMSYGCRDIKTELNSLNAANEMQREK